jgi:hypothetical protein
MVKQILLDLLLGLKYLHANHVAHRDIKLENVLLDDALTFKLGDLGSARRIDVMLTSFAGTPMYMAPEVCCPPPPTNRFGSGGWRLCRPVRFATTSLITVRRAGAAAGAVSAAVPREVRHLEPGAPHLRGLHARAAVHRKHHAIAHTEARPAVQGNRHRLLQRGAGVHSGVAAHTGLRAASVRAGGVVFAVLATVVAGAAGGAAVATVTHGASALEHQRTLRPSQQTPETRPSEKQNTSPASSQHPSLTHHHKRRSAGETQAHHRCRTTQDQNKPRTDDARSIANATEGPYPPSLEPREAQHIDKGGGRTDE